MTKMRLQPIIPALLLPLLVTASAGAQALTGVAHPEQTGDGVVETDHYVKPSHAAAAASAGSSAPAYRNSYAATGPVPEAQPDSQPSVQSQPSPQPQPGPRLQLRSREIDPDASIAGDGAVPPAPPLHAASASSLPPIATTESDPYDGAIVLDVPTKPHELNRGTLLHARLRETVSTRTTVQGAVFTAELMDDVGHHGEVMLPAGSLIRGRVASIRGGRRVGGGAAIRLQPETISLPDGTLYRLNAQVTDLEGTDDIRVQDEGTVVQRTHPKTTLAVLGGVTGTAAVTGAVIGGGVGAAVGAVVGAGVATTWWLKREVQETLPAGSNLIFALDQPLAVTPH